MKWDLALSWGRGVWVSVSDSVRVGLTNRNRDFVTIEITRLFAGSHTLYPLSPSSYFGSAPIHRDVLEIIKLFAQNLRRHFFVRKRERYYTALRLAHVFGCYKLALAVRDNARLHHDFLL